MYGVMYKDDDGAMVFKVCANLDEARYYANNIGCLGKAVTVFEFDRDGNCYSELFTM